jgi:hypothetical protein
MLQPLSILFGAGFTVAVSVAAGRRCCGRFHWHRQEEHANFVVGAASEPAHIHSLRIGRCS